MNAIKEAKQIKEKGMKDRGWGTLDFDCLMFKGHLTMIDHLCMTPEYQKYTIGVSRVVFTV